MTDVPGQFEPEGDLSDNELKLVEQLYGDPVIPPCRLCGGELALQACGGGEPSIWNHLIVKEDGGVDWEHYERSRYTQRRHGDRDVMRLIAEVRRRRQVETGHAGAEPVVDDPRQVSIFDVLKLGAPV